MLFLFQNFIIPVSDGKSFSDFFINYNDET